MALKAVDEAQKQAVLDYIHALTPEASLITNRWKEWFYGGNMAGVPPYLFPKSWDPDNNYADMVAQEINDMQK